MKLNFKRDHIVHELNGTDAFGVIDEIVASLVLAGSVTASDAVRIVEALRHRERAMSTGIGFGIAIPHAATPMVSEVILAFGRSVQGVEFDSLDRQPVKLVVLMLTPAHEKEKHLMTLARISRLLHGPQLRSALEEAGTAKGIAEILNAGEPVTA